MLPPKCEICDVLWRDYAFATAQHVRLDGEMKLAALSHDSGQVANLMPEFAAASEARRAAREEIRRHEMEAHPSIDTATP